MKTIFTLAFTVLVFNFSWAQNWNLLDSTKVTFYQHSDSTHITNTIDFDSIIFNGSDVTYYSNYKLKVCDTCSFPNYGGTFYYRYAKELLGRTLLQDNTNLQYVLEGDTIKHHAQINDTWGFNGSLTATVVSIGQQTFFGILDSVKTIQLSNNDTIIISKNYGIIRYPDFENAGKYFELKGYHQGQNSYGEYLPNFWTTYNFNVGDEFYYIGSGYRVGPPIVYDNYYSIIKVLEDQSQGNEKKYKIHFQAYISTDWGYGSLVVHGVVNSDIIISKTYQEDLYENVFGISSILSDLQLSSQNDAFHLYPSSHMMIDSDSANTNNTNNTIGVLASQPYSSTLYGFGKEVILLDVFNDSLFQRKLGPDGEYTRKINNIFGRVYECKDFFEIGRFENLVGAVINGDTIGDIYSIPDDIGVKELTQNQQLQFYPNPANTQIQVKGQFKSIVFYNQLGQDVLTVNGNTTQIDISALPNGIYFVKATDINGQIFTSKLIKQ